LCEEVFNVFIHFIEFFKLCGYNIFDEKSPFLIVFYNIIVTIYFH
jgi:hypothetical protein